MKQRALWSSIAALAAVHVVLVLAAWWAMARPAASEAPPARSPSEASPATPPSVAVQRLAELLSSAAFRSMITFNYAALNELVRRAAAWPEVIYLSVEDAQGRIIAHTDPARVGQAWNETMAREIAGARGAHQQVTAAVSGPDALGKPSPAVGRVRLGYLVEESKSVAAPAAPTEPMRPPRGSRPPLVVLAVAALAAIPVGFGLIKLGGITAMPGDVPVADLKKIRNLRQARWTVAHWMKEADLVRTQLTAHRGEVQRLKDELAERTGQLAQAAAKSEQLVSEGDHWLGERERLRAELREHHREIEHTRASLHDRAGEADALNARLERAALLETEVADLRDEVREARAALAGHPMACREILEQELRQHQHRAVAYISHAIRSSLTNVLGFSKLLMRGDDGPLNETQRTNVLNIHEAGNHLLRVVNDLSDLTQVEAGTMDLRDEIVDAAAVLREAAATSASMLARDPEAIALDCPPVLPPVRGNKRRLIQILLTLMQPPTPDADGPIRLSARADEESLALIVAHRGAPIPVQDLPTLFDPFSPIDATSTLQDDGGRLRLALARALAATIGGHLAVDSLEETGTTFTVTVPVAPDVQAVA